MSLSVERSSKTNSVARPGFGPVARSFFNSVARPFFNSAARPWWMLLFLFLAMGMLPLQAGEPDTTLLKVGDAAPAVQLTLIDGSRFSISESRGKLILINFFATWCPPCLAELPELETKIWKRFANKGLVVVAVGREHDSAELRGFIAEKKLTFPIAEDPKREAYRQFASSVIPRNYLIGKDGKVIFQSMGFEEAEFNNLISTIDSELK